MENPVRSFIDLEGLPDDALHCEDEETYEKAEKEDGNIHLGSCLAGECSGLGVYADFKCHRRARGKGLADEALR